MTVWKTTWKLKLLLLACLGIVFLLFKGMVLEQVASSLVCESGTGSIDAVVIENFDPNYLLFEAVSTLKREGLDAAVYVPVKINGEKSGPNRVSEGTVELMASISRVGEYEPILVEEEEPIRLNAARQVREHLAGKGYRSVLLVSSGFCSRRSLMVFREVFEPAGIEVSCLPVFGGRNPENWSESWHGIQEVILEFGKLWYYRLWVLG